MIGRVALLVTFKKAKPKPQSLSRSHIRDLCVIMTSITRFITTAIVLLFSTISCQESAIQIPDGGHQEPQQRELIPEPDFALRLQSEYLDLKYKLADGSLKTKIYITEKRLNSGNAQTEVLVARNEYGQVVLIQEFILDKCDELTYEVIHTYYLNSFGNVFAIDQQTNSICLNGDAHQNIVRYYNADFELIKTSYALKGTSGEDLDANSCGSEFDESLGLESNYNSIIETYSQVNEKT